MQWGVINFGKSSKPWAPVPNNASQANRVTLCTDSDASFDYPDWPMWLCLCELRLPWPTCFAARRHRRRHRRRPIRLGTFSSLIFFWWVACVCLVVCGLCCFPHGLEQRWSAAQHSLRAHFMCSENSSQLLFGVFNPSYFPCTFTYVRSFCSLKPWADGDIT